MSTTDPIALLHETLTHARILNAVVSASIAMWVWDYLCMLRYEVEYVWKSPWSKVKILYLLARVNMPFLSIVALMNSHHMTLTERGCKIVFSLSIATGSLNAAYGQALLYLQVYVFTQANSKWVTIFFVTMYGCAWIANIVLQVFWVKKIVWKTLPFRDIHCVPTNYDHNMSSNIWIIGIATGSVLVVVTFLVAYKKYRGMKSRLFRAFMRDGLLYLYVLTLISIAHTVVSLRGPDSPLRNVVTMPVSVWYNIMTARLIIHLRREARRQALFRTTGEGPAASTIRFKPRRTNDISGTSPAQVVTYDANHTVVFADIEDVSMDDDRLGGGSFETWNRSSDLVVL